MKRIIFIAFIFSVMQISAQEKITVKQNELAVDGVMHTAFVVDVPNANSKDAIDLWDETLFQKNLLDKFKKVPKMEKEGKGKWVMKNLVIDEICPDTLDVYTRISELDSKIIFAVLFDTGEKFIGDDSDNSMVESTRSYIRRFVVDLYKQTVQEELEEHEKELEKMKKNYSNYENDNNKLERKSDEAKLAIAKMNEEVVDSKNIIKEGTVTVGGEKSVLSNDAKDDLSDEIKKTNREIKKAKKSIEKYARNIDENKAKQEELTNLIKSKETEIEETKQKLENIK